MAGYKGHLVGGFAFGLTYVVGLMSLLSLNITHYQGKFLHGWQFAAALFVISMLFALWPDIDTNSKGQDIFYYMLFGLDLVLLFNKKFELAAYVGLIGMLPILGKHRGWTHSKIAMVLVPLPILLVPFFVSPSNWHWALYYYAAAFVGYFSHLFLDGLIVPWFRIRSHHSGWH